MSASLRGPADTLAIVLETAFTSILVLVALTVGLIALVVVRRLYKGQA